MQSTRQQVIGQLFQRKEGSWNEFCASVGRPIDWLRGAKLSGANLVGADLSGADIRWVKLSGADLSGANLIGANLSRAELNEANLSGADISNANLSGADLNDTNFNGANLSGADLRWADISDASLRGTIGVDDIVKIRAIPGLAAKVLEQIRNHPETHAQHIWHSDCGTKHCCAGWAVVLAGEIGQRAEKRLGTNIAAKFLLGGSDHPFDSYSYPIPWLEEMSKQAT